MERREQHVPERLVSSIYRLSPPSGYRTKEQEELHLKMAMRRLVNQWGVETVVNLIRKHPATNADEENRKAWLVLSAYAEERKGQRQTSA